MRLLGHARLDPKLLGLIVARDIHPSRALKNRHVQPVLRDSEPLLVRHQLPCKPDRIALEVVAKRKVAQHLEERMMPSREAHVFEVIVLPARAHALLRSGCPHVVPLLRAKKEVFELVHPRVGKQQRGIVGRHQRRRVHPAVLLRLKEVQKQLSYLIPRANLHDVFSVIGRRSASTMLGKCPPLRSLGFQSAASSYMEVIC